MNGKISAGRKIMIINKYFKLYFRNSLKKYDLNAAEGMVLLILYEQKGQADEDILLTIHKKVFGKTQDQIIDELHFDKSIMARTMRSLEEKGYVLRTDNPDDNRSYIFSVTDKATEFKPELIEILKNWSKILLNDVGNLDIVEAALEQMSQNVIKNIKGDSVYD